MESKGLRHLLKQELSLVRAAGGLQSLWEGEWIWVAWGSWGFMGCEKVRIGKEEGSFSPATPLTPPPPQSGSGGYQPVGLWLSLPEASTGVNQLSCPSFSVPLRLLDNYPLNRPMITMPSLSGAED